jgi:ion channel-forming bestrophin family protein
MPFKDIILPLTYSKTLNQASILALAVGAYSILPLIKEASAYQDAGDIPSDMHAALSLILGCLLVFRTNAAYSRWWEARTLWGNLINASRNLSIKLTTLIPLSREDASSLESLIIGFPRNLKMHLRLPSQAVEDSDNQEFVHGPTQTVQRIYSWLGNQRRNRTIEGEELRAIDIELAKLLEICGGCERIARTPFVRSYRIFARQCIALFLLSFPWGVAHDFQWWTVPLTIIVAYFMIGMEIVAEHVEEPFGLNEDDLDLDGMCVTIQKSVQNVFAKYHSIES